MVRQLFSKRYHSVFIAILGPNQSGKTILALYLMKLCYELGLYEHFGTNIEGLKLPFEYDFLEDLQSLKHRCEMLNANGLHRYLFLGDEMGDWAPQDMPWLNIKFLRELQKVRKYGLSFIGCGIARIDKRILSPSYFHGYFEKRAKTQPDEAVYRDWTNYPQIRTFRVHNLPDLKIEGFDTYNKSDFFMEPQNATLPLTLNPEHELVKRYLETQSWLKTGVPTMEGKRAVLKVLNYHFTHCLKGRANSQGNNESNPITDS